MSVRDDRQVTVITMKDQMEIASHLCKMFGLPPGVRKLEITWETGNLLQVKCEILPGRLKTDESGKCYAKLQEAGQ